MVEKAADELAWSPVDRETVYENRIFGVERRKMQRPNTTDAMSCADFFVIQSASWVNIVALTEKDELILIEQWRHGVQRTTLEIPGGLVDEGEDPFVAAQRELLEETGYSASTWYALGEIEPNPAIMDNRCFTFLALEAKRVAEPEFDTHENCRLVLEPYADAGVLVTRGRITHALVVVALHYERLRRDGVFEPVRVA